MRWSCGGLGGEVREIMRKQGESLFLRFRHGTNRIKMDIINKIGIFIEKNKENGDPFEVLSNLITSTNDDMGKGVSIDSTWFRIMEECYSIFKTDLSKNKFKYVLINELFSLLLIDKDIKDRWTDIKAYILTNINHFSMWEYSYNKIFAENKNIQRQEDGTYIEYNKDKIFGIIGAKSLEEEKFDYIMSATLDNYGSIYNLLKFIAIVFVTVDFINDPDQYPKSLNIRLPESDSTCWFLRWEWDVERLYGYSKSGWRPSNNHCDPEWLVSDILASYSEETISKRENKKFDLPSDEITKQYEVAFEGYPYQYACVVETDLIIEDKDEVYFDFKGKKIRWINGETYLQTVIVLPAKDLGNMEEEEIILNEFISSLVWETETPIRKLFQAGAAKRFLPIVSSAKNRGGINLSMPMINFNGNNTNKKQVLALALYKEGINSKSVYYSFLNYYKIIELLFSGKKEDIIRMINESRGTLISNGYSNRISEIEGLGKDLGHYIYHSCRCAVAHAGQIDETVNPDDIDHYKRINNDLPLIKEVAKNIIKSGRFNE